MSCFKQSYNLLLFKPILIVVSSLILFPFEAGAVLGENVSSVRADQVRFKGEHSEGASPKMAVHEIRLADGSIIKEYVNESGLVFAVSWRSRLKPDLEALLGTSFASFAASTSAPSGVAGMKRQLSVRRTNLVVHQSGRMNAFGGLAYVPSLVPAGVEADALR
jgi:hypothetical protein